MPILVATDREVVVIDVEGGTSLSAHGISDRPTCLAADTRVPGRAWCGTHRDGVFRTDDGGRSWRSVGLAGRLIMAVAASPVEQDVVWAGTEPSEVWRSADAGTTWEQTSRLETLSSSSEWSFPPRPDTHHVRWIACHPLEAGRLWVAIEGGALVSTIDGGRTWRDRVAGGPWDTHELAVHRNAPNTLRVSAGDGYFESDDAGATWRSPSTGLEVGYLRSVAIDSGEPEVVVVSASSGPYTAYVAGRSDGRLYRRLTRERPSTGLRASRAEVEGRWERVRDGWPEPPSTIAPLLCPGAKPGEMWAADERGVHRSDDSGKSWHRDAAYPKSPQHLRGLSLID
jgi:ligand-binding sensor domain-containing protein